MENITNKIPASNLWDGIVKATPVLKQGYRRMIRNVATTKFLKDLWIGNQALRERAICALNKNEEEMWVADY